MTPPSPKWPRPRRAACIGIATVLLDFLAMLSASSQDSADAALRFAHEQRARLQAILELNPRAQTDALLKEVRHTFDFAYFTEESLGPRWPGLSSQQKDRFRDVLRDLIETWYLKQTRTIFARDAVTFDRARPSNTGAEVLGELRRDGSPVAVVIRLRPKANQWMVYDIVVDELSFLESYRSQFLAFLEQKDPDTLIEQLRLKARLADPDRNQIQQRQSTKRASTP